MSDHRNYSPVGSGNGGGYGGDWSDDEYSLRNHGREKFRRERSIERDPSYGRDEFDRYDRKKRHRRSLTPPDERRHVKRRPSPHGDYGRSRHDRDMRDPYDHHDGDHYIPNYDRDGYAPAPRYSSLPEAQGYGYPMMGNEPMAMMSGSSGGGGWQSMGRMPSVDLDQLDYIVSFKQFCEHLRSVHSRSHFDDDELQKRYQHYKEKVQARQLSNFFSSNKDKQWFLEKYHPTASRDRIEDMKRRRRDNQTQFLADLEKGLYDDINYDAPAKSSTNDTEGNGEDNNNNNDAADKQDSTPATDDQEYENQLVIKTVPPTIARQRIIEMCNGVDGFEYVVLSEPSPTKKFHRIGWIHFKEGTDMQKAFNELDNQKIDDFVFHLAMNSKKQQQKRTSKVTFDIASTPRRLQKDLDQAKELCDALELELGNDANGVQTVCERAKHVIANNKPEDNEDEEWALKKELDMVLAYLRHVFMYCYYCSLECDSLEEINRRCAEPHQRKPLGTTSDESTDPKQAAKNEKSANQWLKNLDQRIGMRIHTPDDHELERLGGKVLDKETGAFIKEHVLKEHEAKFKCRVGDCAKAFKGLEYVEKHIHAKHPEEINAIKEEVTYYNNYVCDPSHLLPASTHGCGSGGANNMAGMNNGVPFGMQSFMMPPGMRPPPAMQAAALGTPWDQIPRIGFDAGWGGRRRSTKGINDRLGSRGMDLDEPMPRDPRQVKSYVDLDAPAEGEADISFY